jgi:hypothetical protein
MDSMVAVSLHCSYWQWYVIRPTGEANLLLTFNRLSTSHEALWTDWCIATSNTLSAGYAGTL